MRKERIAGLVGLALVSVFPMMGALQVRESDQAWRDVAVQTRPSVVCVRARPGSGGARSAPVGCAVVLSGSPVRAVVAGRAPEVPLCSSAASGGVDWRPVYVDPSGDFTILESEGTAVASAVTMGPPSVAAGMVPIDPATLGDLGSTDETTESVDAVLVAPAALEALPMWVGELHVERTPAGRPAYSGTKLRALRGTELAAVTPADSESDSQHTTIHPLLRGAPFVTADGVVLGLYVGERGGKPHAVPMALVREALLELDRRADR